MKKTLSTLTFIAAAAMSVGAQTFKEWQDPQVNAVNRLPMHSAYFAFENNEAAKKADKTLSTNFMSLNGPWKFNWVKDLNSRPKDFWR
ncbi:MAG: hypothetical protein K2M09_03270, partial [Muribaculaceae bacterium]|nr:hypothetical protein [Muribaculaceae bacterium]